MNINKIIAAFGTCLLFAGFAPAGFAQDTVRALPEGIEVITITGIRPAPALATACVKAAHQDNKIFSADSPVQGSGLTPPVAGENPLDVMAQGGPCSRQVADEVAAQI